MTISRFGFIHQGQIRLVEKKLLLPLQYIRLIKDININTDIKHMVLT